MEDLKFCYYCYTAAALTGKRTKPAFSFQEKTSQDVLTIPLYSSAVLGTYKTTHLAGYKKPSFTRKIDFVM